MNKTEFIDALRDVAAVRTSKGLSGNWVQVHDVRFHFDPLDAKITRVEDASTVRQLLHDCAALEKAAQDVVRVQEMATRLRDSLASHGYLLSDEARQKYIAMVDGVL